MMHGIAGDLFDEVRRIYPGITLHMIEGFSSRNEEWLADGRADIALIGRYRRTGSRGEEVLISSHLSLVGPRSTNAERPTITFRELAKVPLVLPSTPHG